MCVDGIAHDHKGTFGCPYFVFVPVFVGVFAAFTNRLRINHV
jgi:hypothetical protein